MGARHEPNAFDLQVKSADGVETLEWELGRVETAEQRLLDGQQSFLHPFRPGDRLPRFVRTGSRSWSPRGRRPKRFFALVFPTKGEENMPPNQAQTMHGCTFIRLPVG